MFFHQALPLSVSDPLDTLQSTWPSAGHLVLAADEAHTCASVGQTAPGNPRIQSGVRSKTCVGTVLHRRMTVS